MSRNYDDDGRCRWCRRFDGEHRASCVLAPEPVDRDLPEADLTQYGRRDDDELAQRIGEPRRP